MDNIIGTIVGGFFSLCGAGVGGIIGYRTAISLANRKDFNDAKIELMDSFFETLSVVDDRLNPDGEESTISHHDVIIRDFKAQVKAMLKFRPHLSRRQRRKFDKAWNEYCGYKYNDNEEPNYPFLTQYKITHFEGKTTKELVFERVKKILSFTHIKTPKSKRITISFS